MTIRPAAGCTRHAGAGGGGAAARLLAVTATAAVALAACGGSSTPTLPVGPGVTATGITLGVLTDLSGPAAAMGKAITQGTQLFWQDQDRRGGVCGHDVHLLIKDHGGSPQAAAALYDGLRGSVLALQQVLGADVLGGLLGGIARDGMPAMPVAASSKLLASPDLVLTGTTDDLEMIDGIDWLTAARGLRPGSGSGSSTSTTATARTRSSAPPSRRGPTGWRSSVGRIFQARLAERGDYTKTRSVKHASRSEATTLKRRSYHDTNCSR